MAKSDLAYLQSPTKSLYNRCLVLVESLDEVGRFLQSSAKHLYILQNGEVRCNKLKTWTQFDERDARVTHRTMRGTY